MIWRLLGLAAKPEQPDDADAVRRIAAELELLAPDRARYVAAFAYILGRVAHVDQHVSAAETRAMEAIVAEHAGLPAGQAALVVEIARSQNRLFGGTEDFLVTREFGRMATHDEKLALIDCLFAVSASDRAIALVEDNEIRRIAREIRVEHQDVVRIRARYRDRLDVLKRLDEGGAS